MQPGYSLVTLPFQSAAAVVMEQVGVRQLVSWPPKGLRFSRGEGSVVVELSMLEEGREEVATSREAARVVMLSSAMLRTEMCIFSL